MKKKIFNFINNEKIFVLVSLLFFITGTIIFDDYGISWDEVNERIIGFVSLNYVLEKLKLSQISGFPSLSNYMFREYGVIFNLPLAFIENLFKIVETKSIFNLRHYLNFLFFYTSTIYFYQILRKFYSKNLSLIGFLFLILSPRIFAESFYNNKDLIFLSFFIISFYYFINFFIDKKKLSLLFFCLFISLSINIRILGLLSVGILIFFLFLDGLNDKKKLANSFFNILFCLFFVSMFTYIFWPFLWESPLNNLIYTLKSMSTYDWRGLVFFKGNYYQAKNIPWNYSITLFSITTPILYLILFIIGFLLTLKELIINFINIDKQQNSNLWKNSQQLLNITAFLNISIILFFIIEFDSTLYGGWRHLYFLYPSIIILSIYSLSLIKKLININFIYCIVIFSFLSTAYWMVKNHPYQYVYYNMLAKNRVKKNYELDHWGISNIHSIEYINQNYKRDTFNIYMYSNSPYHYAIKLLPNHEQSKFKFVKDINEAEFIVTNHYYLNQNPIEMDNFLKNNFNLIYEIKVNNNAINSIFIK